MKYKKIFFAVLGIVLFMSCNKTDYNYPEGTVAGSKITYYADFTYNGDAYIILAKGETYAEPGVTAKENGVDIPVVISGALDTETPGVYTLVYTAVNKDAFPAHVIRTVIVYETESDAASNDFSGNYARTSNGQIATWTKIAPGVYKVVNPGGAVGASLTVIAFNPTGLQIFIPDQTGSDETEWSSTNESYTLADPPQFSWMVVNAGYGGAQRTFIKQ